MEYRTDENGNPCIYTVTTFERMRLDPGGFPDFGDARTPGFYLTFEEAEAALADNRCDIWETRYDYALVERVRPGLYPQLAGDFDEDFTFFAYDVEEGGYVRTDLPPELHPDNSHVLPNLCIG